VQARQEGHAEYRQNDETTPEHLLSLYLHWPNCLDNGAQAANFFLLLGKILVADWDEA
jgi:hypothetical protein